MAASSIVTIITPDMARTLLSTSPTNRKISRGHMQMLAEDMTSGRWRVNGEPIIIDQEGRLMDGHHRLTACVAADVQFVTILTTGIERDAFGTIDTRMKRTTAQILGMGECANASTVSAGANIAMALEAGSLTKSKRSPAAVQAWVAAHPRIHECASAACSWRLVPPGPACGSYYHLSEIDHDAATLFFRELEFGANLSEHDPVLRLRNRLVNSKDGRAVRRDRSVLLWLIITMWNARRRGLEVKNLKLPNKEKLPDGSGRLSITLPRAI